MAMGEEGGLYSPEKGHNGDRSVYFSMKAIKQKNLEIPFEQRSSIFKGVKMFFNSVKNPDDLAKIVLENGGYRIITRGIEKFTHYVTNNVTAGQQEDEAKRSRPRDHHWVTEAWILESVRAGTRLSEHAFSPFQRKSGDIGALLGPHPPTSTSKESIKRRETKNEHVSIEENPGGFLQHFLANSRLHYIGTWRERALNHYLLMKGKTIPSSEVSYRAPWLRDLSNYSSSLYPRERVVLHADMDCFFVSAVLAKKGKAAAHLRENLCEGSDGIVPVAVAHTRSNSGKGLANRYSGDLELQLFSASQGCEGGVAHQ